MGLEVGELPNYDPPGTPSTDYPALPRLMEEAALDALFGTETSSRFPPFKLLPLDAKTLSLTGELPPS
ncbi:MAG: hypothetical protein AAGG53_00600 [Cyanobacteria bacterium P01_H01_bin.152]